MSRKQKENGRKRRQSCAVVLKLLDAIANSPCMMGLEDIERLSTARTRLAHAIGFKYDNDTNRHYWPWHNGRKVDARGVEVASNGV